MTIPTMTPDQLPPHAPDQASHQRLVYSAPCEAPRRTRVLLADRQELLRKGMRFALEGADPTAGDVEVVGEAESAEQALLVCDELQPDVVLMDLPMPGMGGIEAIRIIHATHPQSRVLALSSVADGERVLAALAAGAIGFLLKDMTTEELIQAVRLAHRGLPSLAPAATQALVSLVTNPLRTVGHDLTQREREVLALMARGRSNQQIAEHLVVTVASVKFHVRNIRNKLGTTNRTETVILAMQQRLV